MSTRRMFGALMTLALVLPASAAFADGFTQTEEPFAKSAEIYADGFHAFAPPAALPTPGDFVTENLGRHTVYPARSFTAYSLKDPGRFKFELQQMDEGWLALGIGK